MSRTKTRRWRDAINPHRWHHAVASEPDPSSGLNCAANLWFVLGTAAHDAALQKTPAWPEALFCLAAAKRSLAVLKSTVASGERRDNLIYTGRSATRGPPSTRMKKHWRCDRP